MTSGFNGDGRNSGRAGLCYVVDDEPAICQLVSLGLRNQGFEIEPFHDAPSLGVGLRRRLPDVVLLDVSLGESDAIEAIRLLSAAGMTGRVHLMSGADMGLLEAVRLIGERYGLAMGPVLTKPFRVDALRGIVDPRHPQNFALASSKAAIIGAGRLGTPPSVDLGDALDRNWIEFWHQPKLDLNDGGFVGAEALARLRHPEHGLLFPESFIANAGSDVLVRLAEYALRTALRDMATFGEAGYTLRLSVNVPVDALVSLPIGAIVRECRRGQSRQWGGIILEVTEDEIIKDIPLAHEIATQLRIHGIDLALDDFGRGYSSLARLKELPFAELKLDRSFVDDCGSDPMNAALCKTVIELAHRFGSLAVAEGIERTRDLAVVQALGCDIAQGFLFSHAMPPALLLARLMAGGLGEFGTLIAASRSESRATA